MSTRIKPMSRTWPSIMAVIISLCIGLWLLPVHAEIEDEQVAALVEALRRAAPQSADADLYSDWKIKSANIPRWSRRCVGVELTPAEFEANPIIAREVVSCVMEGVLREQYQASNHTESIAVRRAASWWMSGNPELYDSDRVRSYTLRVLEFYWDEILQE